MINVTPSRSLAVQPGGERLGGALIGQIKFPALSIHETILRYEYFGAALVAQHPLTAAYQQLKLLPRATRRELQRTAARSCSVSHRSRKWRRRLAQSLTGAALLVAMAQTADAATITVTTNKPGIKADGKCSLIEAITNANSHAATYPDCSAGEGIDTIILQSNSTQTFTQIQYGTCCNAIPTITSSVTIEGNGSILTRKKSKAQFFLTDIRTGGSLTLKNLILKGWLGGGQVGGAIDNGGILAIIATTMTGNSAETGGAIFNGKNAFMRLESSTISGNAGIFGAGIYNLGTLTISNSTISANTALRGGGGLHNNGGTVTIENSTVSGNAVVGKKYYSSYAGGIYSIGGYLGIADSIISGNTVTGGSRGFGAGGGIHVYRGSAVIRNSTISGNKAIGGSGNNGFAAGLENILGSLAIENSTISGNNATGGSGGHASGGGFINVGLATVLNSTISANSAASKSKNKSSSRVDVGGGISNFSTLTIQNSTITGNFAKHGGCIWNQDTGGQDHRSFTHLYLDRTIVSGNQGGSGSEIFNYDHFHYFTLITADNFNIFGANNDPGLYAFTPGASDIIPATGVMINDILAPLADNGGPTLTHALVAGSPAIDAAPVDADCPAEDQRGTTRPQGAMCDIGAFEK